MKKSIINCIKVWKRDMISIKHNPIALLIVAGLCILPSLYAWINIKACWDPYDNTSTISVAVVNNDKSVKFQNKDINIGDEVVNQLKTNHKIGWKFVNSQNADLGVVDGTYYAVIEIPQDFSKDFLSFLSDKYTKPQIIYKVNTKQNPVAEKITDTAASTLVSQITSNFIESLNETAFSAINGYGKDAEQNKNDIINLKDNIIEVNKNMDAITMMLQSINENSASLSSFLTEMKATFPSVDSGLNSLIAINSNNKDILQSTQTTLNTSMNNLDLALNSMEADVNNTQALTNQLNASISTNTSTQSSATITQIISQLQSASDAITSITDYLSSINSKSPNANISSIIESLGSIQSSISDEKSRLSNLQQQIASANSQNETLMNSISSDLTTINNRVIAVTKQYNSTTKGTINTIANNLIQATSDAGDLLNTAKGLNDQIDNLMNTAIDGSNLANKVSGDLNSRLLQYKSIISQLSDKLQYVNNNDIVQIISILEADPKFMGNFVSSPFDLQEEAIYAIPNYGSGMAPVYSVLALWVGALLLTSMLKTEIAHFDGIEKLTIREKHFGKMLTFITLAMIQGLIVSLGDKFILGVYTVNTFLMICFAVFSSAVFATICYTLVSVLGNIGKAISIVYMIVQLAGSGGTYPIQVDPLLFRIFQPLFPFTYSIGGFREAIAGPLIGSVIFDFVLLVIIATFFIFFGFFLKKPLDGKISRFEASFKNSGIGE